MEQTLVLTSTTRIFLAVASACVFFCEDKYYRENQTWEKASKHGISLDRTSRTSCRISAILRLEDFTDFSRKSNLACTESRVQLRDQEWHFGSLTSLLKNILEKCPWHFFWVDLLLICDASLSTVWRYVSKTLSLSKTRDFRSELI